MQTPEGYTQIGWYIPEANIPEGEKIDEEERT
jgi:hypothetical protein